ncbi:Nitroreductase family protein [Chitinispirillum alkaliphilum]|nr:Nitroreductase family protein [Chitinispirillum alkaliphilum]
MLDLLRTRRSIRAYSEKKVDPATLEAFKEVLLRSPSSRSINPWEFIFVQDRSLLCALSESKEHGSSFLKHAALGVVICADETRSDVWVEDCSICAILLQMEAQSRGLGSCWIQIRNRQKDNNTSSEEHIRNVLSIPPHIKVDAIISIGDPAETKAAHSEDSLEFGKIHQEKW